MTFKGFVIQKSGSALQIVTRPFTCLSLRPLLVAAAILHIALAVGLFAAGRARIAPATIDADGIMPSFAVDSYQYQGNAKQLAEELRNGAFKTWISASDPMHIKAISIPFALLGPVLGYGPLSAEPFNLLCYLAVIGLVFALGREAGGQRVGLWAAAIVALWPTFVMHSLQLLKDPLFIAGALAVVLLVTIWLTRVLSWQGAIAAGPLIAIATFVLLRVRFTVGILVVAIVGCGFVMLVFRQLRERRFLAPNIIAAAPALLIAALVLGLNSRQNLERIKHISSDQTSQAKTDVPSGVPVPTRITYRTCTEGSVGRFVPTRILTEADDVALRVGSMRSRFSAVHPDSGSAIDFRTEFKDTVGLVAYLPRAVQIGLWAPFPNTWFSAGRRVGSVGRVLSGVETFLIYICQLLAIVALVRAPRRFHLWLLAIIVGCGVSALALIVANIGALYRFRYTFWILLIVLAVTGLQSLTSNKLDASRTKSH